ncbi:restriction endonuclease subunit S [Kineothrix sp. MSJ-39]|uniref:restriction endonuclease subunit S n=1 Tax=Kineothrix sp. MSJ-39 TaxID=2841533 RepID=UPI00209E2ECE|nr:restriction endonuclease subunit S [Kineothrix sp. MSJ-39]
MGKPKIRFKGFDNDWEQRKFGSLLDETKNKTSVEDEDTLLSCAINGMYLNSELFSHFRGASNVGYLKVKKNDLILSAQNLHLGNCNVNLRFEHGIISPAYKVYELVDCNPLFMQAWVKRDSTKNFFLRASTEGASICRKNIVWEELYKQELLVPDIEEQKKIGAYFDYLDHLITLHQRKCEDTKKLKKYMLQKMFPQNGSKVPEIRFKGFTDDWEQRKLDDVAEFSKGNGYSKSDLIESGTPIILYGRLYTKYETSISDVDTYVEAKEGAVYSKGGEVIVPASGETAEDIARAATVDKSGILLGGDLNVVMPNKDINSAFMAISISNGNSQRELAKKAQGKSVVHIHNEEIKNLIVPFPNRMEQDKIVDYFINLDHLITLHQNKCEELKKIKKYMLQNMFV